MYILEHRAPSVNVNLVSYTRAKAPLGIDGILFDFISLILGMVPHKILMFIEGIREMGL